MKYLIEYPGYTFVGNRRTTAPFTDLKDIDHKVCDQALDIDGNPLDASYKAIYIANSDLPAYDRMMCRKYPY